MSKYLILVAVLVGVWLLVKTLTVAISLTALALVVFFVYNYITHKGNYTVQEMFETIKSKFKSKD